MTKKNAFKGSAAIGNSGIKKHFGNDEPWDPLFELAWNGFDSGASFVAVTVVENEIHGVERVVVQDNGEGIEFATLGDTCAVHAIRPPRPRSSGRPFHGDSATCSTAIRPWQSERSDAGSAFLVGYPRCRQFLHALSHGFSLQIDPVGIVDQPVQDGVSQGGITDLIMPFLHR